MKNLFLALSLCVSILIPTQLLANPPTQALGTCLVDTLNGKERKTLAKWIFFGMGSHPEIKQFSKATPADIQQTDQYVGKLITRLLTIDCPNELKAAHHSDPLAVSKAFELVGKVAMQELVSNPETIKAISNYAIYADVEKISAILVE